MSQKRAEFSELIWGDVQRGFEQSPLKHNSWCQLCLIIIYLDDLVAGWRGEAALVPPELAEVGHGGEEGGQGGPGQLRPRPRLPHPGHGGQQRAQPGVTCLRLLEVFIFIIILLLL